MSELIPTRIAYGRALEKLGGERDDIVVLDADISCCTYTMYFAEKYPQRFFNFGVAEQNMMGAAAGLATTGLIPIANTYAVFASMRAIEQFRTFIAYPRLNVKVAASHGGVHVGADGPTHQGIEDMGIYRTIANTTVVSPADAVATECLLRAIVEHPGPVYFRLARAPVPVIYSPEFCFEIGKAVTLRAGGDVTLVAVGLMVHQALAAAESLANEGIQARVLDCHTVKPLDEAAIMQAAEETGALVTVEDHLVNGGLGSAVAETLGERRPTPMQRIGLRDTFGESGTMDELFQKYGLSPRHIAEAARSVISRKEPGYAHHPRG
jgi:transketolase